MLFRPVALNEIDVQQVVTIELHASGFTKAHEIATKIVTLFRLAEEMLSVETRYDFSLRSAKTLLRMAGAKAIDGANDDEENIIVKAINDYILCKLNDEDARIFAVSDSGSRRSVTEVVLPSSRG